MHPVLFEVGNWPVYSYGVLLALAYLAGLQLAVIRARHRGIDAGRIMDLGIYLIIAALVGAKLMLVAVDFNYFKAQPRELLSLVRAGGVFYGGLLAALAVVVVLVRRSAALEHHRSVRAGIALGHHRPAGLPARVAASASPPACRGASFNDPACQCGHAAADASDVLYDGRRTDHPDVARHRAATRAFGRPLTTCCSTDLALHREIYRATTASSSACPSRFVSLLVARSYLMLLRCAGARRRRG